MTHTERMEKDGPNLCTSGSHGYHPTMTMAEAGFPGHTFRPPHITPKANINQTCGVTTQGTHDLPSQSLLELPLERPLFEQRLRMSPGEASSCFHSCQEAFARPWTRTKQDHVDKDDPILVNPSLLLGGVPTQSWSDSPLKPGTSPINKQGLIHDMGSTLVSPTKADNNKSRDCEFQLEPLSCRLVPPPKNLPRRPCSQCPLCFL